MWGKQMKTKNKIILFTLIVPFIIVTIIILNIKKRLNEDTDPSLLSTEQEIAFKKSFDFDNFENITVEGFWSIHLTQGDHFKIELVAPEDIINNITVSEAENTLFFRSENNSVSLFSMNKRVRMDITLPSITQLHAKGITDILFSNFKNSDTSISMDGVMNVAGENCTFNKFSLSGSGVMNASTNDMPITNAHFDYRGIYNIAIHMNGGNLTGYLDGIGRITVSGEISENNIFVKEPGSLRIIQ